LRILDLYLGGIMTWKKNFILYSLLFISALSFGETYYSDRPRIQDIQAQQHQGHAGWNEVKPAIMAQLASLAAAYPDFQIYLLARDAEYLYDMSQLLLKGADRQRFHLLNVSRLTLKDPNLMPYLSDKGISENSLINNKILLFDTGYVGTIPNGIRARFSPGAQANIKSQMIVSNHPATPSSEVYKKLGTGANPHGDVVSTLEHVPHFTHRATGYAMKHGQLDAITAAGNNGGEGGQPQAARNLMADLKYYAQNHAEEFDQLYGAMKTITSHALGQKNGAYSVKEANAILQKKGILDSFYTDLTNIGALNKMKFSKSSLNLLKQDHAPSNNNNNNNNNAPKPPQNNPPPYPGGAGQGPIGFEGQKGSIVSLQGQNYEIKELIDETSRTRTFRVGGPDHKRYLLTVAKSNNGSALNKIESLRDKTQQYTQHHLPHAKVVSYGQGYLLRERVHGVGGKQWLDEWKKAGSPKSDAKYRALKEMIEGWADNGLYVGNIHPEDLKWNDKKGGWFLLGSGDVKNGYTKGEALERYNEKFESRWGFSLGNACQNGAAKIAKKK
jgi:hypothetical protein